MGQHGTERERERDREIERERGTEKYREREGDREKRRGKRERPEETRAHTHTHKERDDNLQIKRKEEIASLSLKKRKISPKARTEVQKEVTTKKMGGRRGWMKEAKKRRKMHRERIDKKGETDREADKRRYGSVQENLSLSSPLRTSRPSKKLYLNRAGVLYS